MKIRLTALLLSLCALLSPVPIAMGSTVAEFTRMQGEGESVLQGLGIVLGLNGTGDGGDELTLARPLAELLRRNGNPVGSLEELASSRAAALVMVTCVVPRTGARVDDALNVTVSVINSASSLVGGELFVAPLTAAVPGGELYAFAQGSITVTDPQNATNGTIAGGARFVRDIVTTPRVGGSFVLVVEPQYAGFTATSHIAQQINDAYFLTTDPLADPIASALGPRQVRIVVPQVEQAAHAAFVGDVLGTDVVPSRLGVRAQVRADTRTGAIVVDGQVEISPAVITHKDLVITTTIPPPEQTPAAPLIERNRWAAVATNPSQPATTRVEDLLAALKRLDVRPQDQIQILKMLHQAGKLHGQLIIDGAGA
ncbi:MAG: flagellar basal body P-ring protein FlgI [Planctomycetota bacterium]